MICHSLFILLALTTLSLASCGNQLAQVQAASQPPTPAEGQQPFGEATQHGELLGVTCYRVPASVFMMGDPHAQSNDAISQFTGHSYSDGAGPVRETEITTPYIISELIPAELYIRFINEHPEAERASLLNGAWQGRVVIEDGVAVINAEEGEGPVNVVSWTGALAFCEWLSREHDLSVRLPTEAEWELWESYMKSKMGARPQNVTCAWCSDYYVDELSAADNVDPLGPTTSEFQTDYGYQCRVIRRFNNRLKPRLAGAEQTPADAWVYGIQVVIELD